MNTNLSLDAHTKREKRRFGTAEWEKTNIEDANEKKVKKKSVQEKNKDINMFKEQIAIRIANKITI